MEKTEKGGRWRRRIFFSKKNRILLFKWSATALAPKGAAGLWFEIPTWGGRMDYHAEYVVCSN